jgi:protein-S-isoprenylcysteine O-methyltransferase Ste14
MGKGGTAVNRRARAMGAFPARRTRGIFLPMTLPHPPAPGLVAELGRQGARLFRWRSYPPVLVMALVLGEVAVDPVAAGGAGAVAAWTAAGMSLGALGLLLRAWTVGTVPAGTSGRGTRELRAETLNTTGAYSLTRHPLYLGNWLLWVGVAAVAGSPEAALVVTLVFWLYYERIIMAEERFLWERHGDVFTAWAAHTPVFVPRLSGWRRSPHPFRLRFALGRDYPALYAFVSATTAVALVRSAASGAGWSLSLPWMAWFAAGTTAYLLLHALKRLTKALEAPGR